MKAYRWLLLDADDTLFDFDAAEEQALTQLLEHFGVPATEEVKARYRAINSALWAELSGTAAMEELFLTRFDRFFAAMGLSGDAAAWNDYYLTALSHCPQLLPGAEELCRALQGPYELALITNGVSFVQRQRLEDSVMGQLFPEERRFISGDMGLSKPDPAYFHHVLQALGVDDPARVLVIGDSLASDIQGAANAGLDCVWLNLRGKDPAPLCPTYTVSDLAGLGELLLPLPR